MIKEFLLSVVIPVFNEEAVIGECFSRVAKVLETLGARWEMIFVNDGSTDNTLSLLKELKQGEPRVTIIDLSRNFGHQLALTAGLDHARGDAIVTMDADLQDPPELIEEMVAKFKEGYDVVHARRRSRQSESLFKVGTAAMFYKLVNALSDTELPANVGDYRLLSAKAARALAGLREHHRYVRGLIAWLGFKQTFVDYDRQPRAAGETHYPPLKMLRLSLDALSSFSIVPLRVASWIGFISTSFCALYVVYALYIKFVAKTAVIGWTSIIFLILGIGGIQLICLGVIGEYVGIMFAEVKNRPLYLINEVL